MWASLGLGVVEFGYTYPDNLAFFNAFVGGPSHGAEYLVDSNLDWGQDLPLLVQWHREHPHVKIYLAYWGPTDPIWPAVVVILLAAAIITAVALCKPLGLCWERAPQAAQPGGDSAR